MGSWVFIGSWVIIESWVLSGSWVPFFRYAFNRKLNKDIFYEENDWSNKTSNEIKFFGTSHRVFYDDFRRLLLVKNEKLPIKLRTFLLTTRKKKLLKKSVAGSYCNQDDWLEKYAEVGLYKWSSDESSVIIIWIYPQRKVTLKTTLKLRRDIRALSQSFRLMCCKRCAKNSFWLQKLRWAARNCRKAFCKCFTW